MKPLLCSLAALALSLAAHGGECVTMENGSPVYNAGPVLALEKSGLSKLAQAEKIKGWISEVEQCGKSGPAADLFLRLIARELSRLSK